MKKYVVFCLLMQFGKSKWSQNLSEIVTNATNFKANFPTQILNITNDYRRRNVKAMEKMFGGGDKKGEKDDYYDPYHHGGEKVYLWTTRKPPKIQKGQKTVPPSVQPKFTLEITNNAMQIYRDCDRDCPTVFQDIYGIVCGFRFNTMRYINEYRLFNDLCEMQYFNCKLPESRPMWQLAHRGTCPELTTFRPYPTNTKEAIGRAESWLNKSFVLIKKKHPFAPSPKS